MPNAHPLHWTNCPQIMVLVRQGKQTHEWSRHAVIRIIPIAIFAILAASYLIPTRKALEFKTEYVEQVRSDTSPQQSNYLSIAIDELRSSLDIKKTQSYYKSNVGEYGNKGDFAANQRLFKHMHSMNLGGEESTIFIGGTNDAQLAERILQLCPNITLYGFEIQSNHFSNAKEKLKNYPNVQMFHLGWDEFASENKVIGGIGEGGFLYDSEAQEGGKHSGRTVSTIPMVDFAMQKGISQTLYVVIDTEGHEPKVIRGMGLNFTESQKRFPLFQYELGGTWAERDIRHNNDRWTQKDTAEALESFGYALFMAGERDWLMVNSTFFEATEENPATIDEGRGRFVQGNLLAMHKEFVRPELGMVILHETHIEI